MPHIHCRWTLDPDQPVSYPAFCYLSAGPPPPVVKKKPSWKYELKNPDGTSASFLTTGYMPLLAPPEPNSPDLVMRSGVASPSSSPVNQHQSINLLLFLQKQNLATAIYLFGLGTLLTGLGLKHMRICSHHDLIGALVTSLFPGGPWWSTTSPTCLPLSVFTITSDQHRCRIPPLL